MAHRRFIFGVMRLEKIGLEKSVELLAHMLRHGVRDFHSSQEYPSYALFCQALPVACRDSGVKPEELDHMVKLASPHYGETEIRLDDIEQKIRRYRAELGVATLGRVQWMLRFDLKQEDRRHEIFLRDVGRLAELFARLKNEKVIGETGCFPYTPQFGKLAVQTSCFDFIADYVNRDEQGYKEYFIPDSGIDLIAIRPFGAGKGFEAKRSVSEMVRFALDEPGVEAMVASPGTMAHFDEVRSAL